jgi:hypothetical protein
VVRAVDRVPEKAAASQIHRLGPPHHALGRGDGEVEYLLLVTVPDEILYLCLARRGEECA